MVLHGFSRVRAHLRRWGDPISQRWAEAIVLIWFIIVFLGVVGSTGLVEIEKNECRAWKERIKQSAGITQTVVQPTDWQLRQCQAVGIPIDGTPVRR